jgi:hypothetical protein
LGNKTIEVLNTSIEVKVEKRIKLNKAKLLLLNKDLIKK